MQSPLLYIPCLVSHDGALDGNFITTLQIFPDASRHFALAPERLSKTAELNQYTLISQSDYDKQHGAYQTVASDHWPEFLSDAMTWFRTLVGFGIEECLHRNVCFSNELNSRFVYMLCKEGGNPSAYHTIALYSHALTKSPQELAHTPLSRWDMDEEQHQSHIISFSDLIDTCRAQPDYLLGHMDEYLTERNQDDEQLRINRELFALDNTQRIANMCIGQLASTEVQTINGPPGSGKTAMLKAVIAHQWVKAAIEQRDCPITVAVGATNQSVQNVIGAFGAVATPGETGSHYERWIQHISSYGSYLPAKKSTTADAIRTAHKR